MLYQLSYLPGHGSTYVRVDERGGKVNRVVEATRLDGKPLCDSLKADVGVQVGGPDG